MPAYAWANVTRDARGRERRLDELPGGGGIEVEVHLVDLGCGPTFRDWSDAFVAARLPEMRAGAAVRLPAGAAPARRPGPSTIGTSWPGSSAGSTGTDLPVLGPWP